MPSEVLATNGDQKNQDSNFDINMEEEGLATSLKLSSDDNDSCSADVPDNDDLLDDNSSKNSDAFNSFHESPPVKTPHDADQSTDNSSDKNVKVGLRGRRSRDSIKAKKSIVRIPAQGAKNGSNSPSMSTTSNTSSSLKNKPSKTPLDLQSGLKPRKKRKFKGGTYSLYLSKKRKVRPTKSPKKDGNSRDEQKNSDDEDFDSEDGSISLTDSMMTLDSSHEDDIESMQLNEEVDNPDQTSSINEDTDVKDGEQNSCVDYTLNTETSIDASIDQVNIDTISANDKKEDFIDENSTIDSSAGIDSNEPLMKSKDDDDVTSQQNFDRSILETKSLCDNDDSSPVKMEKVNEDASAPAETKTEPSNCDNDCKDQIKKENIQTEEQVKTKKIMEVTKESVSTNSEAKKGPLKLSLRPAFKSLLKAGSKHFTKVENENKISEIPPTTNDSASEEPLKPDASSLNETLDEKSSGSESSVIDEEDEDDDIDTSNKLVIAENFNDDRENENDFSNNASLDENQNLQDNKENGDSSTAEGSRIHQTKRLLPNGKSSIATSVKSRQRIKKKVMEDHVDVDNVSIASSHSDDTSSKKIKPDIESMPTLTGVNGSPMLNGTSPLLSKLPPVQQTEGFLKKITTCLCSRKSTVVSTIGVEKAPDGNTYCQAVDAMYGRIVACCNTVTVAQMHRPSVRIPFMYMCELHKHRLRSHQCCPGCGLFCTEGIVFQCHASHKTIHHFHKRCIIHVNNQTLCPHCGQHSDFQEVKLELNTPQPLNFYLSRDPVTKFPRAKMAFTNSEEAVKQPAEEKMRKAPSRLLSLTKLNKIVSSSGMPLGPKREELETLLQSMSDGSETQDADHGSLLAACQSGDNEKILKIIASGLDPNHKYESEDNSTCLHIVCKAGHFVAVHILIQAGASINVLNTELKPPIFMAIEGNHSSIVNHLIKAGADVDMKGEEGTTALHVAAVQNRVESCRLILDTGFYPNIQDDGGWSPLVWAAEHGHFEVVKLLLERGSDPYLQDSEQNIALHWAAFSGSVDISQLLLDHGCPLNATNINGDTPLHIAARQERYECVVLFLARQSNVNAKNKESYLPIDCCLNKDSQTWMALSMSNELRKLKPTVSSNSDKVIYRDISQGKENYSIQCVNSVDDDLLPTNYLYIVQNCETSPINIDRTITSLQSCNCEDDCTSPGCKCVQISLKCWYDKDGRLLPDFNFLDPPMLFECNRACKCWRNQCNNRVVQDGINCRLQLFRTKDRGWGVRTLKDISRGSFVCEYVGELMSDFEADQREDDSYLFDLDNRDGETYCLDARYYGNVSRFINHLCEPNVVPVKVFIDHQDLSFPRIAFFCSRDIKAYEELGFDYGEKFWMIKYKSFTCTCESTKCKYSKDSIHTTLENYNRRMKDDHLNDQVKKASTVLINEPLL